MSFVEHLDVLRATCSGRPLVSLQGRSSWLFIINLSSSAFSWAQRIAISGRIEPYVELGHKWGFGNKLCMAEIQLKMQSNVVSGQFDTYFNVILIGGFIVAFPYIFWQFWRFTKPALKENELRNTRGVIFWVSMLFFLGVLFGYFVIAPYTISFFANFKLDSNIENIWTIGSYFTAMAQIVLGAGLAFQLPLAMYFLAKIGVVSSSYLRRVRKYAILIIVIVASIITPPDILSTVVASAPLILLYEISIVLCTRVEKREKREEAEWH